MAFSEETLKAYKAFGIEPPKEEDAGQEQESGAPAQEDEDKNAEAQDGVGEDDAEEDADNGDSSADGHEPRGTKSPMSAEERHRRAAERREAENASIRADAKAEAEKQFNERLVKFCRANGLKNTLTGEEFKSIDDLEAWDKEYRTKTAEKAIKDGKPTKETLDTLIEEHPAVKAAKELVERQKTADEEQKREEFRKKAEAEFAEISAIDPTVKSVSDVLEKPYAKEFSEYVRRGLSFRDAFFLCNREAVQTVNAARGKEQALQNQRGKEHLKAGVSQRGKGAKVVPNETMKAYRAFFPNKSEAEITAMYNKQ